MIRGLKIDKKKTDFTYLVYSYRYNDLCIYINGKKMVNPFSVGTQHLQ